ncbi:MAG TPA: prepilin-type N-terminal cleavage/methylation domain-containing protein [Pirellulales bacterium]|jgi:prepilin-type N-terminal cleavage/methylation domain-containing protein|nr:prepilin-type N-terminal cleavage/methylation domain-containing protein [Pirellulales bacterium]
MNVRHTTEDRGHRARRAGFTLVELLVTMGIMVVLAALVAVAVGGAQESAQIAHTRAVIARIHTLLMDRYESYRWRRLPIQITPGSSPAVAAQLRCNAVRELMRMELPDRWTDITDAPAVLSGRTAAAQSYYTYYTSANPTDATYQGADCLYLIVTMGLEENDILENFSQSDIGTDPKNPKMQCFMDSWGFPIQFLRWAPGFNSPLQPANSTDRDQTDPTGVYGSPPATFALYPLIFSAGPDTLYDITLDTSTPLRYSQTTPPNNPFVNVGTSNALGTPAISPTNTTGVLGSYDNVTNQALGVH